MLSGGYRIIMLTFLALLLGGIVVFAGTTGKIAGQITDKETGEALMGVNVIVEGTMLGAATDMDGYFAILNVPPGLHSVKISMIGYKKITVTEVRVNIDLTTPLNVELSPTTFETEDVIVIAERNLLKQDVSTSVSAVDAKEMESLPVSSVDEVIGMQAGVEDGLVVRGGGAEELLFQIDGITMRDPRNNQPISSVALSSIKEISIERGGFNAEYGEVRSGLVNIIAREGDLHNYYGAFDIKYSQAQQKHFGLSVYDPMSMWNRPYLDEDVCWTGTSNGAWNEYTQSQYPEFEGWNTISQRLLSDSDPTNDLSPAACKKLFEFERRRRPSIEPDYTFDGSFGGPVPFVSPYLGNLRFFASFRYDKEMMLIPLSRDNYEEYTGSVKFTSDIKEGGKLMVSSSYGKTSTVAMNTNDKQFNDMGWGISGVEFWNPTDYMSDPLTIAHITNEQRPGRIFCDSWYSTADIEYLTFAAKYTEFLSPRTFFDVSLENVNTYYETGPIAGRDTSSVYEIVPGYFVDEAPFGFSSEPDNGITGMFFGGHTGTMRDSTKTHSLKLKFDLTSQVNKEHMIKTGIEFTYYDLNLDYGTVSEFFNNVNYVNKQWNPYRLSAYVQDKIEMLGFVANVGLRMDMSNPNTEWADVDIFDPDYLSPAYNDGDEYEKKDADIDISFSPRLGLSHPITENSKLYFNYGHFKQMPEYQEIFRIGRANSGQMLNMGNPNLNQAKTVSYELGYDHVLFDNYLIQVAAFYNDITNQLAYTHYVSSGRNVAYHRPTNDSYEDIRGVELTFKRTHGDWVRGFANFTYQVNTEGAFNKRLIDDNPLEQQEYDRNTVTLYQQKPVPQPRANVSLVFLTPKEFGPLFSGIYPLEDIAMNVLGYWRAGDYLTYNPNEVSEVINNVQMVDYFNFDLRLNKTFSFEDFSIMFYMEIRNLFNTKRMSGASFYDIYDQGDYIESLHLPEHIAYNNIPGDDKVGDYRDDGVEYQPISISGNIDGITNPVAGLIYWDRPTGRYMNYVDGAWAEVDKGKMDQILEDKAYIDMPNNTSFTFLNPRQFYFGLSFSFNL